MASKLTKAQRALLQTLSDYGVTVESGRHIEPSVARGLSNRGYLGLRQSGFIDEQWGGFATTRPFLAITPAGRQALQKEEG